MAPVTTPPAPGSMTVPPLFGWEVVATVLVVLVLLAVAFVVVGAVSTGRSDRSEWQAWLAARSGRLLGAPDVDDGPEQTALHGSA